MSSFDLGHIVEESLLIVILRGAKPVDSRHFGVKPFCPGNRTNEPGVGGLQSNHSSDGDSGHVIPELWKCQAAVFVGQVEERCRRSMREAENPLDCTSDPFIYFPELGVEGLFMHKTMNKFRDKMLTDKVQFLSCRAF